MKGSVPAVDKPVRTAFLHYSASPVVGGVEAVMDAHARAFLDAGYPVTVIAGRGEERALPHGTKLALAPEMDSQHPLILQVSEALEQGRVPQDFATLRQRLVGVLRPLLAEIDVVIVHNIFFKHFNLPLTAALFELVDEDLRAGHPRRWIAWGHDFTWTSPSSSGKVFPGPPWDLLRITHEGITYAVVSEQRRQELAGLLGLPAESIHLIYNGVDPRTWFGLSEEGWALVRRLELLAGDPVMLMTVRVTKAKNIEFAERVVKALKEKNCNPKLVITGPPDPHNPASLEYFHELLRLRAELGVEDEVRFIYESGPNPGEPYEIPQSVAAELLRMGDLLFMPSHREGFGMPVLEAGLTGLPVVCSTGVPAAQEIGREYVYRFSPEDAPEAVAQTIQQVVLDSPVSGFKRQIRLNLTWEQIFRRQIEPLLRGG